MNDIGILEDSSEVEWPILMQILEMDEDDSNRDFSRQLTVEFLEQSKRAFQELDEISKSHQTAEEKLDRFKSNADFLHGIAASVGAKRTRDASRKIKNLAMRKSEEDGEVKTSYSDEHVFKRISELTLEAKSGFVMFERVIRRFYGDEMMSEMGWVSNAVEELL